MKNLFSLCLIIFLINVAAFSQTTFQVYLPSSIATSNYNENMNLILTPDSGCVISFSGQVFNFNLVGHILKLDKFGNRLWGNEFRSSELLAVTQIQKTLDGGYILCGTYETFHQAYFSSMLIKTDSFGNVLWKKIYGDSIVSHAKSIRQMNNSDFVFIADLDDRGLILRTDSAGDTLWYKSLAFSNYLFSLEIVENNNILVCGYLSEFSTQKNMVLAKLGSNGNFLWEKKFSGSEDDIAIQVLFTKDSTYLVAGISRSASSLKNEIILMNLDQNGNVLWSKSYAGTDNLSMSCISQTSDSGYVICGTGVEYNNTYDMLVMKTDNAGNLIWSKYIGGPVNGEKGISISQNYSGGYFVAGEGGDFQQRILFVSIDSSGNGNCYNADATIAVSNRSFSDTTYAVGTNGSRPPEISNPSFAQNSLTGTSTPVCISVSIEDSDAGNGLSVFPNPANGSITFQSNFTETLTASLYLFSGRLIKEWKDVNSGINNFNLEDISPGIYLMKLIGENKMYSAKIVVIE